MIYFTLILLYLVHEEECIVPVAKLGATCMCKADKCNRFAIKIPDDISKGNQSNPTGIPEVRATATRAFTQVSSIQPLSFLLCTFLLFTCQT